MTAGRYVLIETVIAAIFSIVFNVGIGWLALHSLEPITLLGLPGLGLGLLPATFMTCVMVTLATTLVTRMRRRRGTAPPVVSGKTWLPSQLLMRVLCVASAATVVLAPLAVAFLLLVSPGPYTLSEALIYNAVYAVIIAVLVAPPVLRATLGETATAQAGAA